MEANQDEEKARQLDVADAASDESFRDERRQVEVPNDAGISTRRGSSQRVTLLIDLNQHPSAFAINHNGIITRYQGFTDV